MVAVYNLVRDMVQTGQVEVVVRYRKVKRSIEQNMRYWALLREIADTVWLNGKQYHAKTWHEHWKRELIGIEEVELPGGKVMERGISTTRLSVAEFGDYMTQIEARCAQEGYPVGSFQR